MYRARIDCSLWVHGFAFPARLRFSGVQDSGVGWTLQISPGSSEGCGSAPESAPIPKRLIADGALRLARLCRQSMRFEIDQKCVQTALSLEVLWRKG